MRAIIQRIIKTNVKVNNNIISNIDKGLLAFIGVEKNDTDKDTSDIASKIIGLRVGS